MKNRFKLQSDYSHVFKNNQYNERFDKLFKNIKEYNKEYVSDWINGFNLNKLEENFIVKYIINNNYKIGLEMYRGTVFDSKYDNSIKNLEDITIFLLDYFSIENKLLLVQNLHTIHNLNVFEKIYSKFENENKKLLFKSHYFNILLQDLFYIGDYKKLKEIELITKHDITNFKINDIAIYYKGQNSSGCSYKYLEKSDYNLYDTIILNYNKSNYEYINNNQIKLNNSEKLDELYTKIVSAENFDEVLEKLNKSYFEFKSNHQYYELNEIIDINKIKVKNKI